MSAQHEGLTDIQFTLDGQRVVAKPGETVLNVARRNGIAIPTLCHHDALAPYGSCRLCVVETFWGTRSKIVTSCIYTPWEGERIETNSERIRRAQRVVLEFLLARCPQVAEIQALAAEYAVDASRITPPSTAAYSERCILCGLCVRVCAEQIGQSAIGYAHRGTARVVTTAFDAQSDACTGCGACVEICPTGALHSEDIDGVRVMKELHTTIPLLRCRECGIEFTTTRQAASVQARLQLTDAMAETCPQCRGKAYRKTIENTITL